MTDKEQIKELKEALMVAYNEIQFWADFATEHQRTKYELHETLEALRDLFKD